MNNKASSIHMTQFCIFFLIFWYNIIVPKLIHINVLLVSIIDKPKYTGLFNFNFIFFITTANKSSENHFLYGT